MMSITEAIDILENNCSFDIDKLARIKIAWQTLKAAVSEQTAHNSVMDAICPIYKRLPCGVKCTPVGVAAEDCYTCKLGKQRQ